MFLENKNAYVVHQIIKVSTQLPYSLPGNLNSGSELIYSLTRLTRISDERLPEGLTSKQFRLHV